MKTSALVLAAVWVLGAARVNASVFVPVSVADLTRSSVAVVVATVERLAAVVRPNGDVATLVTVRIEQTVAGALPAQTVTLREDGGVVGEQADVVFGAPAFAVGERVLLFVSVRPDGSLRTTHLSLGKFRIELGVDGMPRVVPPPLLEYGTGDTATDGVAAGTPLDQVVAVARRTAADTAPANRVILGVPDDEASAVARRELTASFTFGVPFQRFFEPDEGAPVTFLVDGRGDAGLGLSVSRSALDSAFAAWTNVADASIVLEDGGLTSDLTDPCPGPNTIVFDDPSGSIPAPADCHGVLALTGLYGPCASSFESKTFGGRTFHRTLSAQVTFAHGWAGCPIWTACNLAEIAAHELGHAIGLGHSSEDPNESDPLLRDAAMYYKAHFDGRCADLRSDDEAGAAAIYPTAQPPTITTADPLPDARSGEAYQVTLTAVGGTGTFGWRQVGGGVPGLTVTPDGTITGVPSYGVQTFLQIRATDTAGDSHTKVLRIRVVGPTPTATLRPSETPTRVPSPTVTPPATPTPPASPSETAVPATPTAAPSLPPTVTPTVATRPCVGDCNRTADVTIADLVLMVNIALGQRPVSACSAGDRNADGEITVDEVVAAVNAALQGCV